MNAKPKASPLEVPQERSERWIAHKERELRLAGKKDEEIQKFLASSQAKQECALDYARYEKEANRAKL
jgi:hypothetical protein